MKYHIQTFGCQMNYSDSERIASVLERIGFDRANSEEDATMLIFNSCSVRQKAEDRILGLRHTLKRLKNHNPALRIAITGCMVRDTSTRKTEEKRDKILRRMPEVDIAFQIKDLAALPSLIQEIEPNLSIQTLDEHIRACEDGWSVPLGAKAKATDGSNINYFQIAPRISATYSSFVPIQSGCDKFCTYCIVPYARGREFSRPLDEIVQECTRLVENGAVEITLVGQTVNSYGLSANDKKSGNFTKYGPSPFAHLLRQIDKLSEKGLRRLRFTSPHPRDFSDELIQTLAQLKTICPYIHMPVQSGDDAVLRRMNRNYLSQEYKDIMRRLRKAIPGVAISTDIIVGFCSETDQEFENTYKMYDEMEWDMCFLARYSPRKGTYSYRQLKDDVPASVKAARWHRLNSLLIAKALKKHKVFEGQTVEVLVTQQKGKKCIGRTPHFKEVHFSSDRNLVGQFADVHITSAREFLLEGEEK